MIFSKKWIEEFVGEIKDLDIFVNNLNSIGLEAVSENDLIEVETPTNRANLNSIYGVAKEYCNIFQLPFHHDKPQLEYQNNAEIVIDNIGCIKYALYLSVKNISIKTPAEIIHKLSSMGLQSKNFPTDISNVISYEYGCPVHAFDYDKISLPLTVDTLSNNANLRLLNGKTISEQGVIIQRHGDTLTDLLGVMGGDQSKCDDGTKHVIFQIAVIDKATVRNNSRKSRITSNAVNQYSRGVTKYNADQTIAALYEAVSSYCPQAELKSYIGLGSTSRADQSIDVDKSYIARLLGIPITDEDIEQLSRIGCKVKDNLVIVPSWREDLETNNDLAEELIKLQGTDVINPQPLSNFDRINDNNLEYILKSYLASLGAVEVRSNSLTSSGCVKLQNASSNELSHLRSSLLNGMLKTLSKNQYIKPCVYFEIGNVFDSNEQRTLGILTVGKKFGVYEILGVTPKSVDQATLNNYAIRLNKIEYVELPLEQVKIENIVSSNYTVEKIKAISKYPPVIREVSLLVADSVDSAQIYQFFNNHNLIYLAEYLEEFKGNTAEWTDVKSVSFRIFFQNENRTLNDAEVNSKLDDILSSLKDTVEYKIR